MNCSLEQLLISLYKQTLLPQIISLGKTFDYTAPIDIQKGDSTRTIHLIEETKTGRAADRLIVFRTFAITAYEFVKNDSSYSSIKTAPVVQLLFHIRNASLNNNRFKLDKTILAEPLEWKGKRLTTRRNGRECFHKFIYYGDLFAILEEISQLMEHAGTINAD